MSKPKFDWNQIKQRLAAGDVPKIFVNALGDLSLAEWKHAPRIPPRILKLFPPAVVEAARDDAKAEIIKLFPDVFE